MFSKFKGSRESTSRDRRRNEETTAALLHAEGHAEGDTDSGPAELEIEKNGLTVLPTNTDQEILADSLHTWKHKETKFFWPYQLSKDLTFCRIMLFGYDTFIEPSLRSNQIRLPGIASKLLEELMNYRIEPAEVVRPLILIGHSLGGLVIKKLLVECARVPRDGREDILQSIVATVFFGTPNLGSGLDRKRRMELLKAIAKVAFIEVPPKIESLLQLHSDELVDLADQFRGLDKCRSNDLIIYSYYEAQTRASAGVRVVDEFSARVSASNETSLPIQADHSGMVKFNSANDGDYKSVSRTIQRIVKKVTGDTCEYMDGHLVHPANPSERKLSLIQGKELVRNIHLCIVFMTNSRTVERHRIAGHLGQRILPGTSKELVKVGQLPDGDEWEAILVNISEYDFERTRLFISNERVPDTGRWLLERPEIQQWLTNPDAGNLWCHGNVGIGKTVLAASIVEYIQEFTPDGIGFLGYYFCDIPSTAATSCTQILESFLKQLLLYISEKANIPSQLQVSMRNMYYQNNRERDLGSIATLLISLLRVVEEPAIVLDGVDFLDYQSAKTTLTVLRDISQRLPQFRCLLLSRKEIHHNLRVEGYLLPTTILDLSNKGSQEDIAVFIRHRLLEKSRLEKALTQDENQLAWLGKEIEVGAQGMILWAWFKIEELWIYGTSWAKVKDCLASFPNKLEHIYSRCLSRIHEQGDTELARLTFRWMTCASRPLHIDELSEAISINDQDTKYRNDTTSTEQTILGNCSNLISLDMNRVVRFVHPSIQAYLIGSAHPSFKIDLEEGKRACATNCITYLNFSDFELSVQRPQELHTNVNTGALKYTMTRQLLKGTSISPTAAKFFLRRASSELDYEHQVRGTIFNGFIEDTSRYKFLSYASQCWVKHCREMSKESPLWPRFKALALRRNDSWGFHPWTTTNFSSLSYLYCILAWAVRNDHLALIDLARAEMTQKNFSAFLNMPLVDSTESEHETPFHVAVQFGYYETVQKLYKFASADAKDRQRQSALHYAARNGDLDIFHTVIRVGFKIDKGDRNDATPLYLASAAGHFAIVYELLAFGADANKRALEADGHYWDSLEIAAARGHDHVVPVLIKTSADIPVRFPDQSHLLQWIVEFEMLQSAKHLLTVSKNFLAWFAYGFRFSRTVSEIDATEQHLLNLGSEEVRLAKIRQVIQEGLAKTTKSSPSTGENLFHNIGCDSAWLFYLAIVLKKHNLVRLLGGNARRPGYYNQQPSDQYCVPIWVATTLSALTGNDETVAAVVSPNILFRPEVLVFEEFHSPLTWAAHCNRIEAIGPLMANGYLRHTLTSSGFNALHIAARSGSRKLMQALLDQDRHTNVDINMGITKKLKVSLTDGSSFITMSEDSTALHITIVTKNIRMLELLLENGADIALTSRGRWSSLHFAAIAGFPESIWSLVRAGADIDAQNSTGKTPLHKACISSNREVAELLLSLGANPNFKDNSGRRPLEYIIPLIGRDAGAKKLLEAFLKAGAKPEMYELSGLMYTIEAGAEYIDDAYSAAEDLIEIIEEPPADLLQRLSRCKERDGRPTVL